MKTQEQSSILKEEVPKIKEGLLDKYEKEPVKEVTKETTKLPKPTGWRMLVLPFRMKETTKGGVLLGTETIDRQQVHRNAETYLPWDLIVTTTLKDLAMVHGARWETG